MSPKVQSPKSKGLGPRSVVKSQLGYALDASARNGVRLWSKTQPQRLADAKDVGTTPRAAAGAPHTAALRSANLRQVHSPNTKFSILNDQFSTGRLRLDGLGVLFLESCLMVAERPRELFRLFC